MTGAISRRSWDENIVLLPPRPSGDYIWTMQAYLSAWLSSTTTAITASLVPSRAGMEARDA